MPSQNRGVSGGKSHVTLAEHSDPANGRVQRALPSGERSRMLIA
jgi:hypothetical protein